MTVECFGYKCKNVQEGQVLFNQLEKLGYSSASAIEVNKGQLALFIEPEDKIMYWFAGLHEHIFGVDYLTMLDNLTEVVSAIQTNGNVFDYSQLYMSKEDLVDVGDWTINEVTKDNVDIAKKSIEKMKDYPIEISVDLFKYYASLPI